MPFNLDDWKAKAYERLWAWRLCLEQAKPKAIYTTISAMTLWPLVQAAQGSGFASTLMTLASVAAGVGGNLIAEQIQRWRDQAEAPSEVEMEAWIKEQIATNVDIRKALDEILEQLEAIPQVKAELGKDDQRWFIETLQAELASLGNLDRFKAHFVGSGAIAQGPHAQAVGTEGILISSSVQGPVLIAKDRSTITYKSSDDDVRRITARQHYLRRLYHHCQSLPLAALGGEEGSNQDVTLDQVYVDLDVITKKSPEGAEKYRNMLQNELDVLQRVTHSRQLTHAEQERYAQLEWHLWETNRDSVPALEAARYSPRLVLLGDPGGGKSTFVRNILAWLAASHLNEITSPPPGISGDLMPIFITLYDLAPRLERLNLTLLSAETRQRTLAAEVRNHIIGDLHDRWEATDFTEELQGALSAGQCLIVLDGLDEVPYHLRTYVREAVNAVINVYKPQRIIITCRVRSYEGEAVLGNCSVYTLAPFDNQKIQRFAFAWYNAQKSLGRVDAQQAQHRAENLTEAALSEELCELATNPMILTTMALIHQREVGLPKERVRLFSLAVEILLRRWQQGKTGEASLTNHPALTALLNDNRRLRSVVEKLAYDVHSTGTAMDRGDALTILEQSMYLGDVGLAAAFLDYVDQRAGLLVGIGGNPAQPTSYSFPHRTFQEYLAGCHLLSQRDIARMIFSRAGEGDTWSLVVRLTAEELIYNRRRDYELIDLASYLCRGTEMTSLQAPRAALWAGYMAVLVGREAIERDIGSPERGSNVLKHLLRWLVSLLRNDMILSDERREARRLLWALAYSHFRSDAWYLPDEPLLGFVEIPAGRFLMGSHSEYDADSSEDEEPKHSVYLPSYYIARYPVTVAQFRAFVYESGYKWAGEDKLHAASHNLPVVAVDWYDALAYCEWLTDQLRCWPGTPEPLARILRDYSYSITLPSEAEWEKAARGKDGRIYPWGNESDSYLANCGENDIGSPSPVGCFPGGASPYGVEEMSGNVWEWTRSVWGDYPYPPQGAARILRENLQNQDTPRVQRGGAFFYGVSYARCAARHEPDEYNHRATRSTGFRIVISALP